MSHIANQSREIYKLAVGMFGAAPGRLYFDQLNAALEAGMPLTSIYNVLVTSPGFVGDVVELRPDIPNEVWVDAFLDRLLGPGIANVSVAGRAFAESLLNGVLNAGASRGETIRFAIDALDGVSTADPDFGLASARLDNQIVVAQTFTEIDNGSSPDVEFLRDRLALVTADPTSVDAQIGVNRSLPGRTFILTTGTDSGTQFTGTSGNDLYLASPGIANGALADTLQTTDVLDGAGGNDTLGVTLVQGVAAAPTVKNIERITVTFRNADSELSLANVTGVTKIAIEDSSTSGEISNLGGITSLEVRDQNKDVAFSKSTATALNLTVDSVGTSAALNTIDIGVGEAAKATSLTLTLSDAHINLNETNAGVIAAMTIVASGSNTLTLNGAADTVRTLTMSNTGILDLDAVTLTALNELTAQGTSGALKVKVDESAVNLRTGLGNDFVEFTGAAAIQASAFVHLGAGHDTLTITAASADGAVVDGGDGFDRLKAADGPAFITADATDIYRSFEILDVSGGTGAYTMSRLPSVTEVLVNSALSGATTIDTAAAGTALVIIASAEDLNVSKTLTFALKDATGVADSLTVNLIGRDENTDGDLDGEITMPSLVANGIEVLNIVSEIDSVDTTLAHTAYTHTLVDLASNAAKTLNIFGNANLVIGNLLATSVTKIDAFAATGSVTLNASGQAQSVIFLGSSADDHYTASAHGDLLETAVGADVVTLHGGFAQSDRLFFLGGDSQLVPGATGHDRITNFGTAARGGALDVIDLAIFGFTGDQAGVGNKGVLAASVVNGTVLFQNGFFTVGGIQRSVAFGTFDSDAGGPLPADTYVFVDVNKNGNFDAAADLFLQLVGVSDVGLGNFGFA